LLPNHCDVIESENPSRPFGACALLPPRQAFDGANHREQCTLVHFQQFSQFGKRKVKPPLKGRQNSGRQRLPLNVRRINDRHE
jgi:hypothetical protein